MRILLIHQYYLEKNDSGGSRWNEMTKTWASEGHEIVVLAGMVHYATGKKQDRYKGKFTFTEEYDTNIKLIRSHVSEAYNTNFIGRLWAYFSFVFSSVYAGLFKTKGKFDLIVVTSPPLFVGITAYILSKIKSIPFVFEIRDLWPESAIDTGVLKNGFIIKLAYWFEAFMYKKSALINVLTPAFRDTLLTKKHVPAEKIIYIPNAADFSLSEDLLQNFDINAFKKQQDLENKFIITYVGAHGVANHLIQVIHTAELLKDYKDILFLLIGEGMEKTMLKEEATKKGLANIRFIDAVPKKEVFKYILASDLGSSILKKVDTFKTVYSNKTFDYMSCKKPVLMLIDGVSRQLVEDAKCGMYVEPENSNRFKNAILHYYINKDLLKIQGENGYKYANQHFDRTILANTYLIELQKI